MLDCGYTDEDVMSTYPEVILAVQVDLRTGRERGTLVRPWPNDARSTVNGDLVTRRESVVCSIVATNERRIVCIGANTTASHRVGIAINSRSGRDQRDNEVAHCDCRMMLSG
jgi:hypothetical protein